MRALLLSAAVLVAAACAHATSAPVDSARANLETARHKHIVSSPLNWVTPAAAPTLCIHGTEDKYVAHEQAVWMHDRLKACDVPVTLLTLEGAGHGFKGDDAKRAEEAMFAFFAKQLKK